MAIIFAAVLAFTFVCVFPYVWLSPASGADLPAAASPLPVAPDCAHVPASKWNTQVRIRRQLDGTAGHLRSVRRPVCVRRYKILKAHNAKRVVACKRGATWTAASEFGGRGDDNGIGYRGDDLSFDGDGNMNTKANRNSFAELSDPGTLNFAALGGLRLHAVRFAHHVGVTVRSVKRDVGKGGPGLNSKRGYLKRGFDAIRPLARRLRINGLAVIQLTVRPCRGVKF